MFLLLVCIFMLPACDTGSKKDPNHIELVIWVSYNSEEHKKFEELSKRFTKIYKKETGKTVVIVPKRVPFADLVTNIKMACMSQKTPDIARVDVQKILELAYHKVLVKIDQLENFDAKSIKEKQKEYMDAPFLTNVVETRTKDGKFVENLYGFPEQTSCLALFWNRKMFREYDTDLEAAGLDPKRAPRTWDELVAYSKVLTREVGDETYYGFAMNNSLWWTLPIFGCYRAEFVRFNEKKKRKECVLGDKLTCAALQLKVDLFHKHKVEAGAWKAGALGPDIGFTNEKYAMIFMGPWKVKDFKKKGLDFAVSLIPRISDKEAKRIGIPQNKIPYSSTNIGGNDMVIFRSCKHKKEAYDFLNYLTSCEVQLDWCRTLKQITINRRAAQILLGKPFLHCGDFKNTKNLMNVLKAKKPINGYLRNSLSKDLFAKLKKFEGKELPRKLLKKLAIELNKVLEKEFYTEKRFLGVKLREETKKLIKENPKKHEKKFIQLNRKLLEDACSEIIIKCKIEETDPIIRVFMEQIKYAMHPPKLPKSAYIAEVTDSNMELALKGKKSVEEALKNAGEKINENVLMINE